MTSILTLLSSLVKSLQLYLALKNKMFYYEIRSKSISHQKDLIEKIEKLRQNGDSNSSDRADILRSELTSERRELEHLSAFYTKTQRECSHSND